MYRAQQYTTVIDLLEPMLPHLTRMDEGTALHTCLLLLDVHLQQRNAKNAALTLRALESAYADIAYGFRNFDAAVSGQQANDLQSDSQASSASSASTRPDRPPLPLVSRCDSSTMEQACRLLVSQGRSPAPRPPDLPRLLALYRARVALLQTNTDEASAVLASARGLSLSSSSATTAESLRIASAHLDLIRGSIRSSELVMQSMLAAPNSRDGIVGVCCRLHGRLHGSGTRQRAAENQGAVSFAVEMEGETGSPVFGEGGNDDRQQSLVLNNLGVICHQQGKHQLALHHFARASAAGVSEQTGSISGPETTSGDSVISGPGTTSGDSVPKHKSAFQDSRFHSYALAYNSGVQLLMLANYDAALASFERCRSQLSEGHLSGTAPASTSDAPRPATSPLEPMLLFRSAEAAIGLYNQRYGGASSSGPKNEAEALLWLANKTLIDTMVAIAGVQQDIQPGISLNSISTPDTRRSSLSTSDTQQPSVISGACSNPPDIFLTTTLLDNFPVCLSEELSFHFAFRSDGKDGPVHPSTSHDASYLGLHGLKQSTLCKLAYVSLNLLEPSTALTHALQALDLSRCLVGPPWPSLSVNEMLAACYASEALSMLGRGDEAARILGEAHDRQRGRAAGGTSDDSALGRNHRHSDVASTSASGSTAPVASHGGDGLHGFDVDMARPLAHVASDTGVRRAFCTNLAVVMASGRLDSRDGAISGLSEEPELARDLAGEAVCLTGSRRNGLRGDSSGGKTAALLAAYMDMLKGRSDRALELLRSLQG